jgi:hypothetical protein
MKKALTIALATFALGTSGAVAAQDIFGDPNSGSITLEAGFPNDPRTIEVIAGGTINADEAIGNCAGYISDDPDVRLTFTADDDANALPLFISARADGDTTLVINAPDGSWYCNDDGQSDGFNPSVVFGPAQTGDYEIWVGSFDQGEFHEAQLDISELGGQ